jgi:hypothetical protein
MGDADVVPGGIRVTSEDVDEPCTKAFHPHG